MKDVAALAGVSVMTVSNVVNQRTGSAAKETRRRVERAMAELGYHPNTSARALRSDRSDTVAFLLRDPSDEFLADPLTNLIIAGVGDVLRERDQNLLIQAARTDGPPESLLLPVLQGRADGSFALMSGPAELRRWYVERLSGIGKPFLVFDEVLTDASVLSVRAADRDAGRMLTEYLLGRGHERIAFIGARNPWPVVEQRRLGYADALSAAGIDPNSQKQLFEAGWRASGGASMATTLMEGERPPTAVVCASDLLAVGALQAVQGMSLRVPEQVAIAGFDDFDFSAWVKPALTTVRVPAYDMGRLAAGMLLDSIDGLTPTPKQVVLPVELIPRQSA